MRYPDKPRMTMPRPALSRSAAGRKDNGSHMIRINHAVLHAFDFEVGECDLSERELDLDVRQTKSYVTRMARKTVGNPESKHGEFAEGSNFAGELERYLHGQRDFLDLSADVARFFYEELRKSEDAGQCDLLVTDFVDTGDAKGESARAEAADTAVGDAMAAAIEAADDFEGGERRMFAVLLLPRRQAFVHDVRSEGGLAYNDIVRHDSTLPNPSQKVPTFAVVDTTDFSIDFQDVERTIAGQKALLIPKAFLQCSTEASSREVIATVTKIVEDVAEEYGIEPAVAAAKAKSYVIERAAAADDVRPEQVGREVFADEPAMAERYEERSQAESLPESVSVRKGVANRIAKNHRIRTDTGIEITFPSEYASSSEFIEFGRGDDGRITIELKNIGKIENR